MSKLDTITIYDRELDICVGQSDENQVGEISRKPITDQTITCQLPEGYVLNVVGCYETVQNGYLRVGENQLFWPKNIEGVGDCIICDCSTNAGLRLGTIESDDVLCTGCATNLIRTLIEWTQEHNQDLIIEFL